MGNLKIGLIGGGRMGSVHAGVDEYIDMYESMK